MKKIIWLVLSLLLISSLSAENLYQHDSLELELEVKGGFELVADGSSAKIDSVKASLQLYPREDSRQKLLSLASLGKTDNNQVLFEWKDQTLGKKEYSFNAKIKTEDKRIQISKKIPFPLSSDLKEEYQEYLKATPHIDKDDPKIIAKAAELVEGEDDLFKAVFKLARWVEENVAYELNALTAGTSQKASWVLENRQGVCDEMTSLFIAMARAVGIPARFVSGISYTSSEIFKENWLPHGWAEVYFPEYGWVSFDTAFGEYGYVDVTHLKLREGVDPSEASTKFEWLAHNIKLKPEELRFFVKVDKQGKTTEEAISLDQEIIGKEVGLGSYNLIKGTVTNQENYYAATTLKLAVPSEIKIIGENKKIILLEPKEAKDIFWLVKINENLPEEYWYEFPATIYSEKNISIQKKFKASKEGVFYSQQEIERLTTKDEDKKYNREIDFNCSFQKEIRLGEEEEIKCRIKNQGNSNLKNIDFCLGKTCKVISLLINQAEELKIKVKGSKVGWQKVIVKAESPEIEKKTLLEYLVLDDPQLTLDAEFPSVVYYQDKFNLTLKTSRSSFSAPNNLLIVLKGAGFENKWEMEELKEDQLFLIELGSRGLGKKNELKVEMSWEDDFGKRFAAEKTVIIRVEGKTAWEKFIVWFNGLINFLN